MKHRKRFPALAQYNKYTKVISELIRDHEDEFPPMARFKILVFTQWKGGKNILCEQVEMLASQL